MFVLTVARSPRAERLQEALDFVQLRERQSNRQSALADLAHVLLNSSEFLYVE